MPVDEVVPIMRTETNEGLWDPELMAKFLELVKNHVKELENTQYFQDRSLHIFSELKKTGVTEWHKG